MYNDTVEFLFALLERAHSRDCCYYFLEIFFRSQVNILIVQFVLLQFREGHHVFICMEESRRERKRKKEEMRS